MSLSWMQENGRKPHCQLTHQSCQAQRLLCLSPWTMLPGLGRRHQSLHRTCKLSCCPCKTCGIHCMCSHGIHFVAFALLVTHTLQIWCSLDKVPPDLMLLQAIRGCLCCPEGAQSRAHGCRPQAQAECKGQEPICGSLRISG